MPPLCDVAEYSKSIKAKAKRRSQLEARYVVPTVQFACMLRLRGLVARRAPQLYVFTADHHCECLRRRHPEAYHRLRCQADSLWQRPTPPFTYHPSNGLLQFPQGLDGVHANGDMRVVGRMPNAMLELPVTTAMDI